MMAVSVARKFRTRLATAGATQFFSCTPGVRATHDRGGSPAIFEHALTDALAAGRAEGWSKGIAWTVAPIEAVDSDVPVISDMPCVLATEDLGVRERRVAEGQREIARRGRARRHRARGCLAHGLYESADEGERAGPSTWRYASGGQELTDVDAGCAIEPSIPGGVLLRIKVTCL